VFCLLFIHSTTGNRKKRAFFVNFSENLRDTAFFIDEHAVRTVRACAHSRPERSRRIYRRINRRLTLIDADKILVLREVEQIVNEKDR
jgi:hypothetical protein